MPQAANEIGAAGDTPRENEPELARRAFMSAPRTIELTPDLEARLAPLLRR